MMNTATKKTVENKSDEGYVKVEVANFEARKRAYENLARAIIG